MRTSTCRGCGEEIIWAVTDKGARCPMDAEPSPEGTFDLTEDRGQVYATFAKKGSSPDLYVSHFSRCPDRDRFRRK